MSMVTQHYGTYSLKTIQENQLMTSCLNLITITPIVHSLQETLAILDIDKPKALNKPFMSNKINRHIGYIIKGSLQEVTIGNFYL